MADMPTIIETGKDNGNGWGNGPWGAGVGAFIGSMFGNGGFGGWGWGNGGRAMQAGADVAMANQMEHVSDQIQQVAISNLQSANGTQMQIANTGNAQTVATMQAQNGIQQSLCQLGGRLSGEIDANGDQITAAIGVNSQMMADRLCGLNQSVINQGYQNQLQTKDVLTQLQGQHADLKATIIEQGCQDRETMREIAAQAVRDKLAEANAKIANLETRQALTDSNQNQTLYMIDRINQLFQQYKTTAATAGA